MFIFFSFWNIDVGVIAGSWIIFAVCYLILLFYFNSRGVRNFLYFLFFFSFFLRKSIWMILAINLTMLLLECWILIYICILYTLCPLSLIIKIKCIHNFGADKIFDLFFINTSDLRRLNYWKRLLWTFLGSLIDNTIINIGLLYHSLHGVKFFSDGYISWIKFKFQ